MRELKLKRVYRHFKGDCYLVEDVAGLRRDVHGRAFKEQRADPADAGGHGKLEGRERRGTCGLR